MNDTKSLSPKKPRRWTRVLLFVSLAFNLLIVGLVVGAIASGGPRNGPRSKSTDVVTPYTRALDDKGRKSLREKFKGELREHRQSPQERSAQYRKVLELLRADTLDAGALENVLNEQSQRAVRSREIGQSVLLMYLVEMNDDARAEYAQRLEDELDRIAKRRPAWRKKDR